MEMKTQLAVLACLQSLLCMTAVLADIDVLYNTKSATSDLDWTLHPSYNGWEELSGLDVDGSTIRYYQVCNNEEPNQDNWARSQFIDAKSAKRVYVDIEFSVMKCADCRETFTLYYYQSSSNVASSTFPPWRENPFIKVDTVAAGERFDSGSVGPDGINKKTLVLGPLTRHGFYIAVQDQGACMSLMSMRLYYHFCPETIHNLAYFPKTVAGGEVASLISVDGKCVSNAVYANNEVPKYRCNSNGAWKVPTGMCQCRSGYSPNPAGTACEECAVGYYKPQSGNVACQACPRQSNSHTTASSFCMCQVGYYRAKTDSVDQPCTQPPSKPRNVMYEVNRSSVELRWSNPEQDGDRDDLHYSVSCKQCDATYQICQICPDTITFRPQQRHHLTVSSVIISDLEPFSYYVVTIAAHNGVSSISKFPAASTSVRLSTEEAVPSAVQEVALIKGEKNSLTLKWQKPTRTNGRILDYQVQALPAIHGDIEITPITTQISTQNVTISGLTSGVSYEIKVRARTSAGFGRFSQPVLFTTPSDQTPTSQPLEASNTGLVAGIAAAVAVVLLLVVIVLYVRRRRAQKSRQAVLRARAKLAEDSSSNALIIRGDFSNGINGLNSRSKTYVDYRDPHKGVKEIATEIDVSRIKIERVIGRGEFGEVCKGKYMNGKTASSVAVKRLKHGASLIDQSNFLREACTMAQFDDDNIVQLKGVVTKSVPAMIVIEFMDNGSLDRFLQRQRGKLSVLRLMQMLKGIASGMRYLSSMKYVHRDLAARNILVNSDLVCKVSDFGLSRTLENDPHATYTTQGGKIALRWTAPECIRYRQFTSASDVWSYGIVMWEVFSYGEKPYWDMSNDDITEVIEDGYRLPAPMGCPYILHSLMLQCWMYEPRRRPSFIEILAQLDKFINQPSLLDDETLPDQSAPLLNPDSPTSLQEVNTLDEWLDMVKLGRYRRSFYDHGIKDLESLAHITPSDLERLGIASANHLTRLQGGLDTLRRHLGSASSTSGVQQGTRNANTLRSPVRDSSNLVQSSQTFTLPHRQASKGGSTQRDALSVAVV